MKGKESKDFDPTDFQDVIRYNEAIKLGYTKEQLTDLVKRGKLFHGKCKIENPEDGSKSINVYSIHPNKIGRLYERLKSQVENV